MRRKNVKMKKLLSMFLCLTMILSCMPEAMMIANAAEKVETISDAGTMDGWKEFFGKEGKISTENAGGVWTDKSVFTDASAFSEATGNPITVEEDNFLVALSAIGSNMTIAGVSKVPIDTMLVLDVSGSMNDNQGNNDVAEELVEAANTSIQSLLGSNPQNRVGVVLYSGTSSSTDRNATAAVRVLPLGRYTTTDSQGRYLDYTSSGRDNNTTETISLNSSVVVEGTASAPDVSNSEKSKTVVGATYIQKGMILAMEQFTAAANSTTTSDGVKRKPVMVLMSDGAPTLGDTAFTAPGTNGDRGYNLGNGSSSSTALGFVSQLSAAYAKQEIEKKYESDCLFYTLGLGLSKINSNNMKQIAASVLNPSSSTNDIKDLWISYNAAAVGDTVRVSGEDREVRNVTKIDAVLEQIYVDRFFDTDDYEDEEHSLQDALKQAFADIVADIELQSTYFPTLVADSEELSGYVSFVDKIGKYMEVTDVKGILIHNQLFSGADLASNFVAGGGNLGTAANPTDLGDEMVWAVMARLGISTAAEARVLISNAYESGQLSYTSPTEFSNYIGWYADASGKYIGFWDGTETASADSNAVYTVKSYGYLGEVDESHGVAKSDMMYATVQVREEIATGEQMVSFAIPAALLPVVTYNVELNSNEELEALTVEGADHPIRLVYEVGLKEEINPYNINEIVSEEYLNTAKENGEKTNVNEDGSINFYTNQYEVNNTTGYGKINTYSYFRPSKQNDRYYFLQNSYVYSDDQGTLYEGTEQPSGNGFWRSHTVYEKDGEILEKRVGYHNVTSMVLEDSVQETGTNNWYIPEGHIRENYATYNTAKTANLTETLQWSNAPFIDAGDPDNQHQDDPDHTYIIGATLGNNGRLTVTPETGIKISKEMAESVDAPEEAFTFILTNTTNADDNTAYPTYKTDAEGTAVESTLQFTNGTATVELKAGETIYIGGMTAGDVITVEETETADYKVETVNNAADTTEAVITVAANTILDAEFVNTERGKGNLTVAKEVTHDFGTDYQIPADKTFTIDVTLSGVGTANAVFTATQTNSTITSITTDAAGSFTVTLRHNEKLEIYDLPAGTVATVIERNPGDWFEVQYWDNGVKDNGVETIVADTTVSVLVLNDYTPDEVYPVNIDVSGNKTLTGRTPDEWLSTDSFTFELQKWIPATATTEAGWEKLGEATVTGTDLEKKINFNDAFKNEAYEAAGMYYYRVVEIEPETGAIEGVSYDKTVHSFGVTVTDADMDGQLEIAGVTAYRPNTTIIEPAQGSDTWGVEVDFTNTYSYDDTETVVIELNKTVANESGSPLALLSGFQFGLYDSNGVLVTENLATNQQNPSYATTDRGYARMALTYTTAGKYTYTLKEIVPTPIPAGWTYDSTPRTITVLVTDDQVGGLDAVIYEGSSDTAPSTAGNTISQTFANIYDPEPAELPIDFVSKELTGRTLEDGEFTFAVYDALDTSNPRTPILTGTNVTVTEEGQKNVAFNDTLKFDQVGTYFYDIVETSEDGRGVTTDKNVYRVTVTVTDGETTAEGVRKLTASYTLINVTDDEIVFKNTYTVDPTTDQISGTKVLTGMDLLKDEFTFVMTEATDATGNVAAGAAAYKARNAGDGSFSFPEITYTKAGTYYYLVTEENGGTKKEGIAYDGTKYVVTVTVTDNLDGTLSASHSTVVQGTEIPVEIVFTNEYEADPVKAAITGRKILDGKTLTAGAYSFNLYAADAQWNKTKETPLETVSNAADGSFSFAEITYTQTGTYYYLATEVDGGTTENGITNDDTVFGISVTVTDNLRGQLVAEIHVFEDGIGQPGLEFVNIYSVTGTARVELPGTKILEEKTVEAGDYSFDLYSSEGPDSQGNWTAADKIDTVSNAADKTFKFELNYTAEDVDQTFYYIAKEVNAGQTINGVTYSSEEYHITVIVSDNGIGGLTAVPVINKGDAVVTSLDFTNTYATESTTVTLPVEKTLSGRDWEDGETFTFNLTAVNGGPVPADTTLTLGKPASGNIASSSFGAIEFTSVSPAEGYTYQITEVIPTEKENGMIYDEHIVTVNIKVTDDGQGQLVAEVTSGEADFEKAAFTNFFHEPSKRIVENDTDETTIVGEVGKLVEFKIYYKNPTNEAVDIDIVDELDDTLTFVEASDGGQLVEEEGKKDKIVWDLNGVEPSAEELYVTFTARLNALVKTDETTNQAEVTIGGHKSTTNIVTIPATGEQNLTISKTVVRADGKALSAQNAAKAFSFKVQLKDANDQLLTGYTYQINGGVSQEMTYVDGWATITLTHGQSAVIAGLPIGAVYTVEEVEVDDDGYTCENVHREGTISSTAADNTAAFTNIYTLTPLTKAVLTAQKILKDQDKNVLTPLKADQFTFAVYEDEDCTKEIGITAGNHTDGSVVFPEQTFTTNGENIYYIKEVENTAAAHIEYDDTVYKAVVTIVDNNDGTLSANPVEYSIVGDASGQKAETATFTNVYKDGYNVGSFNVKAHKVLTDLTGNRQLKADEFSFGLYDADGKLVATGTNDANGNVTFSDVEIAVAVITAEEPTESAQPAEGETEETVDPVEGETEETVDPAEGETEETVDPAEGETEETVDPAEGETEEIVDPAEGETEETVDPAEGETEETVDPVEEETTETTEPAEETEAPVTEEAEELTGPLAVLKSLYHRIAAGVRSFTSITAYAAEAGQKKVTVPEGTASGDYWYTIKEIEGDISGIRYDTATEYKVKVTVIDDGSNLVVSAPEYYKADGVTEITEAEVVFNNEYKVDPTGEVKILGSKVLTGRKLKAGEFTFIIRENGDKIAEAVNAADGTIEFNMGTYETEGTHEYVITESKGSDKNIVYSTESYKVIVVITDDGSGTLKADVQYPEDGVVFHNKYNKPEEKEDPKDPTPEPPRPVSPKTGDTHNIVLMLMLCMVSVSGLVTVVFQKKKIKR